MDKSYNFKATVTATESGRCDFTRNATYSWEESLDASEIKDIIEGAESRDEMIDKMEEWIREKALDDGADSTDDEEYSDHEVRDTYDEETDSNAEGIIDSFLEDNPGLDPDNDDDDEDEEEEDEDDGSDEEEDEPVAKAEPVKFKVRDRVRPTSAYDGNSKIAGKEGNVIAVSPDGSTVDVEFDDEIGGHTAGGNGKKGHCWCFLVTPSTSEKLVHVTTEPDTSTILGQLAEKTGLSGEELVAKLHSLLGDEA